MNVSGCLFDDGGNFIESELVDVGIIFHEDHSSTYLSLSKPSITLFLTVESFAANPIKVSTVALFMTYTTEGGFQGSFVDTWLTPTCAVHAFTVKVDRGLSYTLDEKEIDHSCVVNVPFFSEIDLTRFRGNDVTIASGQNLEIEVTITFHPAHFTIGGLLEVSFGEMQADLINQANGRIGSAEIGQDKEAQKWIPFPVVE